MVRFTDSSVIRLKLILSQMAIQGLRAETIEFFKLTYHLLSSDAGTRCIVMSKEASLTRQSAMRHARFLLKDGYVIKEGRTWRLSPTAIKDPDLLTLFKMREAIHAVFAA